MKPEFPPYPGARRIWSGADGLAVIDELDDEVHALIMRVWKAELHPTEEIAFQLDPPETRRFREDPTSTAELVDQILKRPGFYQGRREQTATRRALVRPIWRSEDGEDRLDQDDQGELWMDVAVATGITRWRTQFRLHRAEAAACAADPEQARDLARRAKASPNLFRLRPPERWEPGKKKRIWQDPFSQWMLEEDDAGDLWLGVVVYDSIAVSLAEVRLQAADGARCRGSWEAARKLADRIGRAKGRYP